MKKRTSLLLLIALICLTGFSQNSNILVKGSDTCLPLLQKESEQYHNDHPESSVTVIGGGSGVGLTSLAAGTTDIAMSSRILSLEEKVKLLHDGNTYQEKIFAKDALSVIVHPSNKIDKLTREQLEAIFTGKITNWKELGGEDMPIIVYSRETSSGSYAFFKEHVLNGKNFTPAALLIPATGAMVQSLSQTRGGIGYSGIAYVRRDVKTLALSFDSGKTYVLPASKTVQDNSYPIARPLYLYYFTKSQDKVQKFMDFIFSAKGQEIVQNVGYIPIN
jgi:phosphate transport system substrate-binding protein